MSPAELKMQPTIHFQSERGYFKYCIVLERNYEAMMALLPIILFVTIDIYRKMLKYTIKMYSNDEKIEMILIYGEYNKTASAVAHLCRQ
jgi:hypothetical protein